MRPSNKKKETENLVQNQPLARGPLTCSYWKMLLLPQDIKSNVPPHLFYNKFGNNRMQSNKNLTLKLLRDSNSCLAKLDNGTKDHEC